MSDGQFGQFHTGEKIYGSASVKKTNWSRFVPVFDEDETCVMHVYIYIFIFIQYVCRYYIQSVYIYIYSIYPVQIYVSMRAMK